MRIFALTAPVFAARCYLLAADDGSCVVVDAGGGVAPVVARTVAEHGLRVVGVLATHGHADHVWDAPRVAAAAGVPVRLHARDAYRLADPLGTLTQADAPGVGPALRDALVAAGEDPAAFAVQDVLPFAADDPAGSGGRTADVDLELGGVRVLARHAPGHTEGSTLYLVEGDGDPVVLTGDVLFAGSVGRTDLPGGDPTAMAATLREVVGTLPGRAVVLPGHGPATRVDDELATNPYLAG